MAYARFFLKTSDLQSLSNILSTTPSYYLRIVKYSILVPISHLLSGT